MIPFLLHIKKQKKKQTTTTTTKTWTQSPSSNLKDKLTRGENHTLTHFHQRKLPKREEAEENGGKFTNHMTTRLPAATTLTLQNGRRKTFAGGPIHSCVPLCCDVHCHQHCQCLDAVPVFTKLRPKMFHRKSITPFPYVLPKIDNIIPIPKMLDRKSITQFPYLSVCQQTTNNPCTFVPKCGFYCLFIMTQTGNVYNSTISILSCTMFKR